jgi:hypothetical protein
MLLRRSLQEAGTQNFFEAKSRVAEKSGFQVRLPRAHTLALGAIRVQRMLACVCVCVPQARRRARQKG